MAISLHVAEAVLLGLSCTSVTRKLTETVKFLRSEGESGQLMIQGLNYSQLRDSGMEEGRMPKAREEELQDITGGSGADECGFMFGVGARATSTVNLEYGTGVVTNNASVQGGRTIDDVHFEDIKDTVRSYESQSASA